VSRALFGSRVRATEVISVKDGFVASLAKMVWTAPDGISVPDW
jgi:hypothetical protein